MGELYTQGATATVGKKELAAALGWSRPTLDKRVKTDPNFPVVSRGDQSGGWHFHIPAVQAYLAGAPAAAPPAIDRNQLRDSVKPPPAAQAVRAQTPAPAPAPSPRRSAYHQGEATARQRKDEADAGLKEMRLQERAGELVARDRMRQMSATVIANLAAGFDSLAGEIVKRQSLPAEMEPAIQAQLDEMRQAWVTQSLAALDAELAAEPAAAAGNA